MRKLLLLVWSLFLLVTASSIRAQVLLTKFDGFHPRQSDAEYFAKHGIVIFNPDAFVNTPTATLVKQHNPDVVRLLNTQTYELPQGDARLFKGWNRYIHTQYHGVAPNWWMRTVGGQPVYFESTYWRMVNPTHFVGRDSLGRLWRDWYAEWMRATCDSIEAVTGEPPEGAFVDVFNMFQSWHAQADSFDINRDGQVDHPDSIDTWWSAAVDTLGWTLRQVMGPDFILITNGQSRAYDWANGTLDEGFLALNRFYYYGSGFKPSLDYLATWADSVSSYGRPVFNVLEPYLETDSYAHLRFTYTATRLVDAFFLPLRRGQNIGGIQDRTLWFDEFDFQLGSPTSPRPLITDNSVMARYFANGMVICNPTSQAQTVDLGGEYYRLCGEQDPATNDGSGPFTSVVVPPRDGLILRLDQVTCDNDSIPDPEPTGLLANAGFEDGIVSPWVVQTATSGVFNRGAFQVVSDEVFEGQFSLRVDVTKPSDTTWVVNARQVTRLERDVEYTLEFYAKSDSSYHEIQVVSQEEGTWKIFLSETDSLSNEWQYYKYTFTPSKTTSLARIELDLGWRRGSVWLDSFSLSDGTVTSVFDERPDLPRTFTLEQNYPNPFNPSTTIRFNLQSQEHVQLRVYDLLGREVMTLVDEPLQPGQHSISWDGKDWNSRRVASGTYVYRLVVGNLSQTKKMILVK